MLITFNGNQSFADVAEKYTIGGADYGAALARLAGKTNEYEYPAKGFALNIPDSWFKQSWLAAFYNAQPSQPVTVDITGGGLVPVAEQKQWGNWMLYAALGVVAVMLLTGRPRTNRRNRR